jgi:hypothetical protein
MKKSREYIIEFLSILFAVLSAFALDSWNETRKNRISEKNILMEINAGLEKDLIDIEQNISGHRQGMESVNLFLDALNNRPIDEELVNISYLTLFSDFISLQNTSGYEILKSKGFEVIRHQEIRKKIISLYEYAYPLIRKMEEEYYATQFRKQYADRFKDLLLASMRFDEFGNFTGFDLPLQLSDLQKKELSHLLWELKLGRSFSIQFYNSPKYEIEELKKAISEYLKEN